MKLQKTLSVLMALTALLSCLAIGTLADDSDFVIEDGVLLKYNGKGGNIVIPEGVKRIYIDYFPSGEDITSISLPKSLETITHIPTSNCSNLTKFSVHSENKYFSAMDGILYDYDKTTIVIYPPGKTEEVFTVPNSVTKIGDGAFTRCENLTRINLGYKITEIGTGAFSYCIKITSFDVPDNVTTMGQSVFLGCSSLSSIVLSENLTIIDGRTFGDCTALKELTIPKSVSTIRGDAFDGCDNLSKLTVDAANESFVSKDNVIFTKDMKTLVSHSHYLTGHYTVPDGVEYLNSDCFSWGNLESITLPDTLKVMGDEALCCIWHLEELTIPEGVTEMGHGALRSNGFKSIVLPKSLEVISSSLLYDCDYLTSVTISPGTTTIGSGAFAYDRELSEVTIPYSVSTIKDSAFIDCSSLKEITLMPTVKSIGKDAFSGCEDLTIRCFKGSVAEKYAINNGIKYVNINKPEFLIEESTLYRYTGKGGNIVIPDTVTKIGTDAFRDCTALTDITIPDCVTKIGEGAFRDCTSLKSVTIPKSVTSIGDYVFWGCTSLSSVTIPDSVTSIGNRAFRSCTSLSQITLPDSITHIGGYIFGDCGNIIVTCTEGSYAWQYAVDNGLIAPPETTPVPTKPPATTVTEVTEEYTTEQTTSFTEKETFEESETKSSKETSKEATETSAAAESTFTITADDSSVDYIGTVLVISLAAGITVLIGCGVLVFLDRKGVIDLTSRRKKHTPVDASEDKASDSPEALPEAEDPDNNTDNASSEKTCEKEDTSENKIEE